MRTPSTLRLHISSFSSHPADFSCRCSIEYMCAAYAGQQPPAQAVNDAYGLTAGPNTVVAAVDGVLKNDVLTSCPAPTITVVTQPTEATSLTMNNNGGFTYVPKNLAIPAADSFQYTVTCNGQVCGKCVCCE